MERFKKVSRQTIWQLADKAITSLSMIFILGMVTRVYGATGTGVFTLSLTLLSFLYLGVDFGINAHVMPEALKNNFSPIWQKIFGLRLILASLIFAITLITLLVLPLDPSFKWAMLLGLPSLFAVAAFFCSNLIFQSRLRFDLFTYSSVAGSLAALGLIALMVGRNWQVSWLLLAHTVGWIIASLFSLWLVRHFVKTSPILEKSYSVNILSGIWPLSLTVAANIVYFRIDAFILTAVKSFAEVGIYNLAYQIFQTLLVVPAYIMNSFYPLMVADFYENRSKFILSLKKSCLAMFGIGSLGTVLTIIFAPIVITIITGDHTFTGSTTVLQVLSLGFPGFFVTSVLMWTMVILKKYKLMLVIYLVGLAFNALANWIFIPQYSYLGAAVITGASEYLILILQLVILIPALRK